MDGQADRLTGERAAGQQSYKCTNKSLVGRHAGRQHEGKADRLMRKGMD